MLGTISDPLHILTYLFLLPILWGKYYYVSNFADEEVESQKGQGDCPVCPTEGKGKEPEH